MKKCNVLLIVLLLLLKLSACTLEERIPTDGVWYCAELQAQFTVYHGTDYIPIDATPFVDPLADESENYIIVNDDRIAALWGNDRGSTKVSISCQEPDHPDFDLGEIIYLLEFVSLSDTEYVLKDDAGKQYTFMRIGDTPELRIPTDGVWYCVGLQARFTVVPFWERDIPEDDIAVVNKYENCVVVNGDRITASWKNKRGSTEVEITCQEPKHPDFDLGETIYLLEFVSLSDTEYVLKDDAGKQYTFMRIGDTPIKDD